MAELSPNADDVLIVVDVQNDFCPGGPLAVPTGDEIVPVINRLISRFANVIATQDWHPRRHSSFASQYPGRDPFEAIDLPYGEQTLWPDHCVQGTAGAEFHRDLDTGAFEMIVRKGFRRDIDSYSAFFENDRQTNTGLDGYLRARGLKRAYLCGLAGDVCVYFSALDAKSAGFDAIFIEDACRDIDMNGSRDKTRADLRANGVTIASSADILT